MGQDIRITFRKQFYNSFTIQTHQLLIVEINNIFIECRRMIAPQNTRAQNTRTIFVSFF